MARTCCRGCLYIPTYNYDVEQINIWPAKCLTGIALHLTSQDWGCALCGQEKSANITWCIDLSQWIAPIFCGHLYPITRNISPACPLPVWMYSLSMFHECCIFYEEIQQLYSSTIYKWLSTVIWSGEITHFNLSKVALQFVKLSWRLKSLRTDFATLKCGFSEDILIAIGAWVQGIVKLSF